MTDERVPQSKRRRRVHSEGAVYRRASDDRWVAVVDAGYVDGKRKRLTAYARTRKEATEKIPELRRQARAVASEVADIKTVAQFLDHWLVSTVAKTRAAKTVESYRDAIRLHIAPAIGGKRLMNLNRVDVQRMLDQVARKPKPRAKAGADGTVPTVGPRTVENVRAVLRAALNDAKAWASGAILVAPPQSRDELDHSFSGLETEVCVGHIRVLERHKGWIMYWAPATDEGRLRSIAHDWRA